MGTMNIDLERFKGRLNIHNIVSNYTELEESGENRYRGLCPFHRETQPSFTVYNDTNSFYCFGCGRGGDVINFVMEIEDITFKDAVEQLEDMSYLRP